jgi:hypothetical protein
MNNDTNKERPEVITTLPDLLLSLLKPIYQVNTPITAIAK